MTDWDAQRYHRLSDPQLGWGRRVLLRLAPAPGERILDVGCGTGRLTVEIAQAAPGVRVVGVDRSGAMLGEAARSAGLDGILGYVRADGVRLPFAGAFDAVFSAATFHWIQDHPALFAAVHAALRKRGRLVAQCGGEGNLARLLDRTHELMNSARFRQFFSGWTDPWVFAGIDDTRVRLAAAGFTDIEVSLEPAPTRLAGAEAYRDFIACVCVRHHIDRLPPVERAEFVEALADGASTDDPPFTLDYWRLNIAARRAPERASKSSK
jgi:trans-aconitate methyltransferase